MATANGKPVKLVWRSGSDGYFYENEKGELIRCDHSGDGRYGEPAGPDHCDHDILVLDTDHMKTHGVFLHDNHGAALLPLKNGQTCIVEVDKGLQFVLERHPEIEIFARFGDVTYQLTRVG